MGDTQFVNSEGQYGYLLHGEWLAPESANYMEILSPADDSFIGFIPMMRMAEVERAIQSSREAQKAWAGQPVHQRAEILLKTAAILDERAVEIGSVIMMEVAKRRSSAIDEVKRTAELIRYAAEEGRRMSGETLFGDSFPGFAANKISLVSRVPLGVVLAISPFNYPVNLAASKLAPALVTGNAVVFKPATQGSISALHMVKAFHDAGVPAGVLNVAIGRGSEIGDALVQHPGISAISFTGGSSTGARIAKLAGMIPLVMELGGKDAAIVLADADLDLAAKQIVSGAFSYSGQRCTAVKRVLIQRSVADALVEKMVPLIQKLRVGMPSDDADITPLIDDAAADFVEGLVDDAVAHGAHVLTARARVGRMLSPLLLDNVSTDMRIAWEEPFGPVLPVIRLDSAADAVEIANASEYGLQSSVFTRDINLAFQIAQQLEVGSVQINGRTERGPDHFPFVGVKSSGMGTQGVAYSLQTMTRQKSTVVNLQS